MILRHFLYSVAKGTVNDTLGHYEASQATFTYSRGSGW